MREACTHPDMTISELGGDNRWCAVCGAISNGTRWMLPGLASDFNPFKVGEADGYDRGVAESAAVIKQLEYEHRILVREIKAKADEIAAMRRLCDATLSGYQCSLLAGHDGNHIAKNPASGSWTDQLPTTWANLRPTAWQDYEHDTDDVCTIDGFDGICLTTGEVNVTSGLRMSAATARQVADRLHAWLEQRRERASKP